MSTASARACSAEGAQRAGDVVVGQRGELGALHDEGTLGGGHTWITSKAMFSPSRSQSSQRMSHWAFRASFVRFRDGFLATAHVLVDPGAVDELAGVASAPALVRALELHLHQVASDR